MIPRQILEGPSVPIGLNNRDQITLAVMLKAGNTSQWIADGSESARCVSQGVKFTGRIDNADQPIGRIVFIGRRIIVAVLGLDHQASRVEAIARAILHAPLEPAVSESFQG